jgi:large subunit ribosomal protein L15
MLKLEDLKPSSGSRTAKKRVGRGNASHGTYSGRGVKGQRSRAGFRMPPGFEGGQTPLWKRVPKRGFTNYTRKEYSYVNLDVLSKKYSDGSEVTPELLIEQGVISTMRDGVKILGRGDCESKLKVTAHKFSKTAVEKIEAAGGEVIWLEEAAPVQKKAASVPQDSEPVEAEAAVADEETSEAEESSEEEETE